MRRNLAVLPIRVVPRIQVVLPSAPAAPAHALVAMAVPMLVVRISFAAETPVTIMMVALRAAEALVLPASMALEMAMELPAAATEKPVLEQAGDLRQAMSAALRVRNPGSRPEES